MTTTDRHGASTLDVLQVIRLLDRHERRAASAINMVPSENSMSPLAKLPLVLDVYHRYFFNDSENPDEWNFRGGQDVSSLETRLALPLLRELTGAAHVNLRPLSGLSGMTLVLSALGGPPGSTVMTVSPEQGGHYATASIAERLGLKTCFATGPDPHTIDYDGLAGTLRTWQPGLVYIDQSNCLFPIDVGHLVQVVRDVAPETVVHIDASHWLGLVFGRQLPNPLALGADSFGGSTHKSFPGPQKAVYATNRDDLAEQVRAAQYFMISSHHFGASIALGLALLEFKECGGADYARRVVENTVELGAQLAARGIDVVAADRGFSRGHQLWIRTVPSGVDAFVASDRLYEVGIRVNAFPELPGLDEPVLRIGLNEATYHGLRREDMGELADVFAAAVHGLEPPSSLRERVALLRAKYAYPYSFVSHRPEAVALAVDVVSRALRGCPAQESIGAEASDGGDDISVGEEWTTTPSLP